ncbi:ribose-phosphate pyrophosphokinase [Patescibacteria group bacterium]|nr:ribose-phosphate pyrophosphokinase [Patescibacteria group bacterium]
MHIISGSSNPELASSIVKALNQKSPSQNGQLIKVEISKFGNNEKRIWINDEAKVRGQKICIVQSFSEPVDENIIETLLIIDALERLGAREVSLIVPWMGYSLQDKVFREGEAIAAKVVANLISNTFVSRVFLLDLHNPSIPGFFSIPTYHLSARNLFIDYLKSNKYLDNAVVVSPDFGGLKKAKNFAKQINLPLLNIDKSRDLKTGEVTSHTLYGGEVAGKKAIIFDDVINSGGTAAKTAALLKKEGALEVIFTATHGIFCSNGLNTIEKSQLDRAVVSNSIAQTEKPKNLEYINLAPLFADALIDWI